MGVMASWLLGCDLRPSLNLNQVKFLFFITSCSLERLCVQRVVPDPGRTDFHQNIKLYLIITTDFSAETSIFVGVTANPFGVNSRSPMHCFNMNHPPILQV